MNSLSVCVSLLALFGCAAANSLWTRPGRAFDPDTVERPIEEYREEYRRNVLERRQGKRDRDRQTDRQTDVKTDIKTNTQTERMHGQKCKTVFF